MPQSAKTVGAEKYIRFTFIKTLYLNIKRLEHQAWRRSKDNNKTSATFLSFDYSLYLLFRTIIPKQSILGRAHPRTNHVRLSPHMRCNAYKTPGFIHSISLFPWFEQALSNALNHRDVAISIGIEVPDSDIDVLIHSRICSSKREGGSQPIAFWNSWPVIGPPIRDCWSLWPT